MKTYYLVASRNSPDTDVSKLDAVIKRFDAKPHEDCVWKFEHEELPKSDFIQLHLDLNHHFTYFVSEVCEGADLHPLTNDPYLRFHYGRLKDEQRFLFDSVLRAAIEILQRHEAQIGQDEEKQSTE